MAWNKQVIPTQEPRASDDFLPYSPALMRPLGAIGFFIGSIGTFYLGTTLFGLESDFMAAPDWNTSRVIVLIVALLAGGIGGFMGVALSINIPIKSDQTHFAILVMWHYVANGSIAWLLFMGIALGKIYGGEQGVKDFLAEQGQVTFTLITVGTAWMACLACSGLLLLTRQIRLGEKADLLICLVLTFPLAVIASVFEFKLLDIRQLNYSILQAVVFTLVMVIVSSQMIERDQIARRKFSTGL